MTGSQTRGVAPSKHSSMLTKDYFRSHSRGIDDNTFEQRWRGAMQSPLRFMRSFVEGYYAYAKKIGYPGKIGICFGDSHPENYGFVLFGKKDVEYVYNDLDDSGYCPLSLDAARYFTALALYDEKFLDKAIEDYLEELDSPHKASKVESPSFKKLRKELIKDYTAKHRFLDSNELAGISEDKAIEISSALNKKFPGRYKIYDIKKSVGKGGGSLGLTRYWVLTEDKVLGKDDIVEFKRLADPATAVGNWGKDDGPRPEWLSKTFWKKEPSLLTSTELEGHRYLIRSRVKHAISLGKLSKSEKKELFKTQVRIMARHHKSQGLTSSEMEDWLKNQVLTYAADFSYAYNIEIDR
ncbi:DUF2252 family protein [bacterium]|nr:DUF2252 family protein [bacterium]